MMVANRMLAINLKIYFFEEIMEFKRMKIAIESDQHAIDCICELERLGYTKEDDCVFGVDRFIHTEEITGSFDFWYSNMPHGELTTIEQLKAME